MKVTRRALRARVLITVALVVMGLVGSGLSDAAQAQAVTPTTTSATAATTTTSRPADAAPSSVTRQKLLEATTDAQRQAQRKALTDYLKAHTMTSPDGSQSYLDCGDAWACLVQFVGGWNRMMSSLDGIVDWCCTDVAVYLHKGVSQGAHLMQTAGGGVWAPVAMYFASLGVCKTVGVLVSAAATPIAGTAASSACSLLVTIYSSNFWTEVARAEDDGTCLALRFYWQDNGIVPWFGTQGGEKCQGW